MFSLLFLFAFSIQTLHGLFEGDIMLTPEQESAIEVTANPADPFAPQRAVVKNPRNLWTNGRVPYAFSTLNGQAITAIRAAMADYTRLTCITFVPRTSQQDYVQFFSGQGCYSNIGKIGGRQRISIGRGCEYKGIVIHEIFHALGRWHEQSRPDRDMFVRILRQNIQSGKENNFRITSRAFTTTQGIAYDFGSIMHYRSTAFSLNRRPTILPIDRRISPSSLGQRNGFSSRDVAHVKTLYCIQRDESVTSWSSWSSWTQCSRTCNGGTRTRMRTCDGGTTCEGSNIEAQECNIESCQVPASWGQWGAWGDCTTSCGSGRQRRSRSCVGGNTCVGIMSQFRDCNTQACPQPATWGSWGSWSSCSRTCQGGFRHRTRTCQNGNTCPGLSIRTEYCNVNITCSSQTYSGKWSSWSTCNAQCGGGKRFRSRMCGSKTCGINSQLCNTQECKPEPNLRGISHHGCWHFDPQSHRLASLEQTTPDLKDDPVTRQRAQSKCAMAALWHSFKFFSLMNGYCVSGSNSSSDYKYYRSSQCQNGTGGLINGRYLMDVYEVTDQLSFKESVVQATSIRKSLQFLEMLNKKFSRLKQLLAQKMS